MVYMMRTASLPFKQAFSLVELSIVLVILGLLVGGVLSGQSLIRAAELRSISSDYSRYIAASQSFRDKYFALPGDMTNATAFWQEAHATPATCRTTVGTGTATCNGNGNGTIASFSLGVDEHFRAWQHLANAGLIEGTYTGVTGAAHASEDANPAVNVPRGRISNSGFGFNPVGSVTNAADTNYFVGNYGNAMHFGGNGAANMYYPLIKPEEQWNLDTKMDDGLPHQGFVRSFKTASTLTPGCAAASNIAYDLVATGNLCSIVFTTGF